VEGARFEIPTRIRPFHSLSVGYARRGLSRIDLIDPRHGTSLAPLYPVDRAANVDGRRATGSDGVRRCFLILEGHGGEKFGPPVRENDRGRDRRSTKTRQQFVRRDLRRFSGIRS
jgi:hypothetical protein